MQMEEKTMPSSPLFPHPPPELSPGQSQYSISALPLMAECSLNALQGLSCHSALHLSTVFIYSLVASELNHSKRLTGQLLCEISLFIAASLSVRRINMAEISGGRRVSGEALLPEKE